MSRKTPDKPGKAAPSDENAEAVRDELIEVCLHQIFAAFDEGCQQMIDTPVVFLVDCQDEIGGGLARAWKGDAAVERFVKEQSGKGATQDSVIMLAAAYAYADCCQEVPETFPYLAGTFEGKPPEDGFIAVVVAAGGAATYTVPHDARS